LPRVARWLVVTSSWTSTRTSRADLPSWKWIAGRGQQGRCREKRHGIPRPHPDGQRSQAREDRPAVTSAATAAVAVVASATIVKPIVGFLKSGRAFRGGNSRNALFFQQYSFRYSMAMPPSYLPPILFEDEWLIAFDKPNGLLTEPDRWNKARFDLISLIHQHLAPGIYNVHRLDADTSGVLLCAKPRSR